MSHTCSIEAVELRLLSRLVSALCRRIRLFQGSLVTNMVTRSRGRRAELPGSAQSGPEQGSLPESTSRRCSTGNWTEPSTLSRSAFRGSEGVVNLICPDQGGAPSMDELSRTPPNETKTETKPKINSQ